ncbi:MAG: hypothetical protein QUU85_00635, partial [Candidatus Eisenbacteria bacterium]|nr:hypothetical protein [Candidatus Eisenbacteria bacterium]
APGVRGGACTSFGVLCALASLCVLGALCVLPIGCGDDESSRPPEETAEQITAAGWDAYEDGKMPEALECFQRAIGKDPEYEPAYVGEGWTRLALAQGEAPRSLALARFGEALRRSAGDPDALAGRAAVLLAYGWDSLDVAAEAAAGALALEPAYVFLHRATFNADDLCLIRAYTKAVRGDLAGALEAAEAIEASGFVQDDAATWRVDGVAYDSFAGAVLAWLDKLSRETAG